MSGSSGFLENIETFRIQVIAIVGSLLLILLILELIRRKKLKEKYALLWLFSSFSMLILSIWRDLLEKFSYLVGIAYAPATLFLFIILFGLMLFLHFSVIVSILSEKIKKLTQKIGLLEKEIKDLRKNKK